MTRVRVIGLGQAAAGDDGVGLEVLRALRQQTLPRGLELHAISDPSALVPWLEDGAPLILVDAARKDPPGQVLELSPEELAACASPLSSHGLAVADAIELARALAGGHLPPLRIVAITIARPERYGEGLSREVAQAVPAAAARVLALIGGGDA